MKVEFNILENIIKAVKKYGKATVLYGTVIFALVIMFEIIINQNKTLFDKLVSDGKKVELVENKPTKNEVVQQTPNVNNIMLYMGIATVTVMGAFVQCVLSQNRKMMEKFFEEKEHEHSRNIHKRRLANGEVEHELKQLLYKLDADTTFIGEYHNGNKNLGGLAFLKFSITYEQDSEDINPLFKTFQEMNISNFKLFDILNKKYYAAYEIESLKENDKLMYYLMSDVGIKNLFLCEIRSLNKPLGFIGVAISKDDINQLIIQKDVMETANRLSVLLTYNDK